MPNPYSHLRPRAQLLLAALKALAPTLIDGSTEITRTELCRETGFSRPTVTNALADLTAARLVTVERDRGVGLRIKVTG